MYCLKAWHGKCKNAPAPAKTSLAYLFFSTLFLSSDSEMYYYIAIHKGKEKDVPKPANCTLAIMQLKRQDGLLMRHFTVCWKLLKLIINADNVMCLLCELK
jgi:hypothetical protein